MKCWWLLSILLVFGSVRIYAEEGFVFPDMDAVINYKDDNEFIFAPPRGYLINEIEPTHDFAILYRLINDNGALAVELAIDEEDVLYELEVLASGQSFYLFIGDHWLSDGENTTILSKQDYSEFIRVFNSRDSEGLEDSQSLQSFVAAYEQNWKPKVTDKNELQDSIDNLTVDADATENQPNVTGTQNTEPHAAEDTPAASADAGQAETAINDSENGIEREAGIDDEALTYAAANNPEVNPDDPSDDILVESPRTDSSPIKAFPSKSKEAQKVTAPTKDSFTEGEHDKQENLVSAALPTDPPVQAHSSRNAIIIATLLGFLLVSSMVGIVRLRR